MRLVGTLATVLIVTGCAPMATDGAADGQGTARRCFTPAEARLIKLQPSDGAYVRVRSGEALLLTGEAACLSTPDRAEVVVRAVGLAGSDICLGDPAHLDLRSHAAILRTCNVQVARVVPQSEISRLPARQSP
ncbi:hypothetical protein GGQ87_001772 [Brevundimonas alba]|uniref:Lipoprotein n=1 Tax=Brevundimonas alba TaxID=74314 RepID=A0A7X5YMT0_9CAUL|nr:hypothetical protein [Brevundimonas alba]NJC41514.1 hypothetical protein [Brevundimonas alba]